MNQGLSRPGREARCQLQHDADALFAAAFEQLRLLNELVALVDFFLVGECRPRFHPAICNFATPLLTSHLHKDDRRDVLLLHLAADLDHHLALLGRLHVDQVRDVLLILGRLRYAHRREEYEVTHSIWIS